jgi:hypothetical protein
MTIKTKNTFSIFMLYIIIGLIVNIMGKEHHHYTNNNDNKQEEEKIINIDGISSDNIHFLYKEIKKENKYDAIFQASRKIVQKKRNSFFINIGS